MSKLWVKFGRNNSVKVSTKGCQDVNDFLKACKKELSSKLGSYDVGQLSLSTTDGGPPLRPGLVLTALSSQPGYVENDDEHPLFNSITDETTEMISMPYGKAQMPFIGETTGIDEEDIPFDNTVEASSEFVELFKKNCSVFEFESEASRRTLIDLFLREIVSQLPEFQVICEYRMILENKVKKRRLSGKCDYTICHRGLRNLPHLVAIEAKMTNLETVLQCIGECASIHYRRKEAGMRNLKVYGIHSTGSVWKFVFIDENGSLFVSKEYYLNPENYIKEGFDQVYRLAYYVVKQTFINRPRTTPAGSSVSINR